MIKKKANGTRGSWFATVDGETLPCVHKFWWRGSRYHDPYAVAGDRQWDELIGALIERKKAILTDDERLEDGSFRRTGYIAKYEIDDVSLVGSDLKFSFIRRLDDLV